MRMMSTLSSPLPPSFRGRGGGGTILPLSAPSPSGAFRIVVVVVTAFLSYYLFLYPPFYSPLPSLLYRHVDVDDDVAIR